MREHYDGCTPFYANGKTGVVLYDLLDENGRPVQLLPKPEKVSEPMVAKTPKTHERAGRFYLVKHTCSWGLVCVDGTGKEQWLANKNAAKEAPRAIPTPEGEAERRAGPATAKGGKR